MRKYKLLTQRNNSRMNNGGQNQDLGPYFSSYGKKPQDSQRSSMGALKVNEEVLSSDQSVRQSD